MAFNDIMRRAGKLAIDNSPHILSAVGVIGTVATAVLASKASFTAADIIRLKEGEEEEAGRVMPPPGELAWERIQLTWKLYIPAGAMGIITIASIVGADRIGAGRIAGMATAYGLLERNFSDHRAKVVEKFGERKAGEVAQDIAQDRLNDEDPIFLENIALRGLGDKQIFHDFFGGQYFRSTVEDVRSGVNQFNSRLLHNGYANLAEFYHILDNGQNMLEVPGFAEHIGWNSDRLLEITIEGGVIQDKLSCLTIMFKNDPRPDYGRFH